MAKKPYIKPNKLSSDLEELKAFMDFSVDINHWNEKRDIAKKYFTKECISLLDASKFINEAIKPITSEELNKIL